TRPRSGSPTAATTRCTGRDRSSACCAASWRTRSRWRCSTAASTRATPSRSTPPTRGWSSAERAAGLRRPWRRRSRPTGRYGCHRSGAAPHLIGWDAARSLPTPRTSPVARQRTKQLEYSQLQEKMLDEAGRRAKATKMLRVLEHFLGRRGLDGLLVADIGCSAGFIADELHRAGARTIGVDIDVPGLARAQERFGDGVSFLCADGERLPLADESIDIAVFNHIYEHVVDPDAVVAELRRVLRPDGVIYLGLGNRWGIMEPHYRLPF